MANTILVGAQWGDEGKGKIIDLLTEQVDVVVRAQGGNNAGHTVIDGTNKYVLHLVPSGILHPSKVCVVGNGVVIDPPALVEEIDGLAARGVGITPDNLKISDRAHIVFPYHRLLDEHRDLRKGDGKIGTTKRGIGPAYGDKAARTGLRMIDLAQTDSFPDKLRVKIEEHNPILQAMGASPIDTDEVVARYSAAAARLAPFVTNTVLFLHGAMREGRGILFEGAQGTLLDLDHGSYPFVTSSNTTAGGACTGSGVPPHRMDRVLGVMKAYTTRVGEGPFPTENAGLGDTLHSMGREFGATTGRARRCGWFDAVASRYSVMLNGIDELAVTNIDGLDHLDRIQICVAYELDGRRLELPPADPAAFARCQPVYEELPGWRQSLQGCTGRAELPAAALAYLDRLSALSGAPVTILSVGAKRSETIFL